MLCKFAYIHIYDGGRDCRTIDAGSELLIYMYVYL